MKLPIVFKSGELSALFSTPRIRRDTPRRSSPAREPHPKYGAPYKPVPVPVSCSKCGRCDKLTLVKVGEEPQELGRPKPIYRCTSCVKVGDK